MTVQATRDTFVAELTTWLNSLVQSQSVTVDPDTKLFEGGLINSIRILEVIAWVERASGRRIADREIRMDNFATAQRIADVFGPPVDAVR